MNAHMRYVNFIRYQYIYGKLPFQLQYRFIYQPMHPHHQKPRKQQKIILSPNNQYVTYVAQPQPIQAHRHTTQVQRIHNPVDNINYVEKRLTHRPQIYYTTIPQVNEQYQTYPYPKLDRSLPTKNKQPNALKKMIKRRQFQTKQQTPRMTANVPIQTQFQDGEQEYIVIPTRTKNHHFVTKYSDDQMDDPEQYQDGRPIQKISILSKDSKPIKMNKQTMIPIMVPASSNKTIQYIRNQPVYVTQKSPKRVVTQPMIQVEQRNIRDSKSKQGRHLIIPQYVNYAQNQRHSYKRSEHGPAPNPPMVAHGHRRLATTAQLIDEDYSKTQTEDEVLNQQIDRYQPQQYQYEQPGSQEVVQQSAEYDQDSEQEAYEDIQYVIPQYQQYQGVPQQESNFYKVKKHKSEKKIQKQIKARFKDIEDIMQTQNQNLKDHNQYLIAVIKKMQSKDRKQRALLVSQNEKIKSLSQQRNAYRERCMQLQGQIEDNSEKGLQKHCSVLTLDLPPELANEQNSTASDAINDTVGFTSADNQERLRQLGGLRQHLKHTIAEANKNSPLRHYKKPVGKHILVQTLENGLNANQVNSPTPKFQSKKDSPQRRPRLTTRMSNSSKDSDPSGAIFNNNSSEIMNNSNSFGGGWVNTNSGFNVIKTLSHNLIDLREDQQTQQINQQPQSFVQESDDEIINPDDLITAKNSGKIPKIKYTTKTDEQDIEQLNKKFEQLMKIYRTNHDIGVRKQCVQIAKKIKEIKNEVQLNKQQEKQQQRKQRISRKGSKIIESDAEMQGTRVKSRHKRTSNIDSPLNKDMSN